MFSIFKKSQPDDSAIIYLTERLRKETEAKQQAEMYAHFISAEARRVIEQFSPEQARQFHMKFRKF